MRNPANPGRIPDQTPGGPATGSPAEPCWREELLAARRRIAGIALPTPLIPSPALSERTEAEVYLKLETLQPTGSFKLRGATNKLVRLLESTSESSRVPGVVTFSTGNHGRAVAYVARRLGLRAVVCVSEGVPPVKLEAIRRLGAELVFAPTQDDAEALCARLAAEQGLVPVHPFDDPDVIAGQGTVGLEILDDLPDVEAVVVPLSGGGLLSGVGLALRHFAPGGVARPQGIAEPGGRASSRPAAATGARQSVTAPQLIGVSMERGPVMFHSLRAGRPITLPEEPSLADSLLGGIGLDNRWTFRLVRDLATDVVLVSEEAIARAMAFMLEEHGLLVEGGAATAVAALLESAAAPPDSGTSDRRVESLRGVLPWRPEGPRPKPRRVVVVVTGRNVDPRRVVSGEPLLQIPKSRGLPQP
ncbi:Pyridoxal-5'-phosphate-dependent protein beta subunit [Thermaerobacter marianensis DSM 12885]|uniref:threonine ammonia-lyase n=1 Tax=Thermaerobacter marianensis (strain ATCC 700841 / DSM 12885 / JCM 10246 / 7p75a) TaxID=644966 RepID=E6SHU8_THEM7|nr:pyridoxal-phosphate dependent enzyme [Thermaerobacter marianensis]ADU50795.1 Pyridoxal-5'-phosphate-dependent protein beta subunit [Thermaerobacter marianensis DSM 12885]